MNFFYTECPGEDGCSLVTFKLSQLFSSVKQNEYIDKVQFVSISFDYVNDTIQDLINYSDRFTNDTINWQFLTGNKTEIDQVTSDWNFYYEFTSNITIPIHLNHHPDKIDPYDHSFIVYLIDSDNFIRKFLLGSFWEIDDAFASIEYLINEVK